VKIQKTARFFSDIKTLGEQLEESSSLQEEVVFVVDKSYHQAVSERFAHASAALSGEKRIAEGIELAIEALKLTEGDQLFVLSDHGCKLSNDDYSELGLMNRDRSQIFFFHSRLDGGNLHNCESLLAMEDVHAIVKKALNTKTKAGKVPVLAIPPARKMVHVEDHVAFSTKVGDPTRKWAVFSKDFEYFETLDGPSKLKVLATGIDRCEAIAFSREYLSTQASDYRELRWQLDTLQAGFSEIPSSSLLSWENKKGHFQSRRVTAWNPFWRIVTLPTSVSRLLQLRLTARSLRRKKKPRSGSSQGLLP
jgi:hypothetical protein